MTKRGSARAYLGVAMATALWSCGASILGDDPATGIALQVTRGPIQPVAREGELNEEPVAGAVVMIRANGGGSTRVTTDALGNVAVRLVPGDYRVAVTDCPGALVLPGELEVRVIEGEVELATVSCDTGIR